MPKFNSFSKRAACVELFLSHLSASRCASATAPSWETVQREQLSKVDCKPMLSPGVQFVLRWGASLCWNSPRTSLLSSRSKNSLPTVSVRDLDFILVWLIILPAFSLNSSLSAVVWWDLARHDFSTRGVQENAVVHVRRKVCVSVSVLPAAHDLELSVHFLSLPPHRKLVEVSLIPKHVDWCKGVNLCNYPNMLIFEAIHDCIILTH